MKPRVLIVDDSVTVRMDLKDALEEAGILAFWSATVAAAREALARVAFDVVILDVLLPDGDGLDLLRDIKASPATEDLPVMLLSSEAEVADRALGLGYGADEYLGKPYNPAQVVAWTRALWQRRLRAARDRPLVLVVDDSATFRERVAAALEQASYEVAEAATGEEGLRLAAILRPDAVLLDQKMPGLHGSGVLRALRADAVLRRTPCLLLTASNDRDAELRALDSGADAYLAKDGDMELVLAKLGALLQPGFGSAAEDPGSSLLEPKRVLAVGKGLEDFLAEVAERLRGDAYDVVTTDSGEEALTLLAAQAVDAILLDQALPGLKAEDFCRRVKAHAVWRNIPLLLLTDTQARQSVLAGIQAGADDIVLKSEDFHVFQARLKARLRRRQFEAENRVVREQLLRRELEALELRTVRELAESRAMHIAELEARNHSLVQARDEALALVHELESFRDATLEGRQSPADRGRGEDGGKGLPIETPTQRLERILSTTRRMGRWMDDLLDRDRQIGALSSFALPDSNAVD
ncbi:MAG: response regulator [bacterium]